MHSAALKVRLPRSSFCAFRSCRAVGLAEEGLFQSSFYLCAFLSLADVAKGVMGRSLFGVRICLVGGCSRGCPSLPLDQLPERFL